MKLFKNIIWIVLFSTSVVFFNSCNKETNPVTSAVIVDDNGNGGNDNNSGNGNGNNNGNNNSTGQQTGTDGEITLYKVENGNISKISDYKVSGQNLAFQKDIAKHNQIWDLVKKIVPENQLVKMSEFMIYDGEVSGSAGYVVDIKTDLSKWQMGIAINYAYDGGFNNGGELAYTIIHEFGHILTLNDTQLNAAITRANCSNYYPGEGCAKSSSYINELFQNYWKDIANEHEQAQNNQTAHQAFYNKYQDRFVTAYASTNPGEDIAEVFTNFVVKKNKPSGASIAEKKMLLMYNRSGLIDFRNHIRKNLNLRGRGANASFELPKPGAWKQANSIGNPFKTKCRH